MHDTKPAMCAQLSAIVALIWITSLFGRQGLCVQFVSKQQHNTTVTEGDSVVFSCAVLGMGTRDKIVWENGTSVISYGTSILSAESGRTSVQLSGNNCTLHISHVTLMDEGHYSCRVTGHSHFLTYTLTVQAPPRVRIKPETGTVALERGQSLQLTCLASGKPKPIVIWSRSPLAEANRQSVAAADAELISHNRDVSVEEVDWTHAGTYTCTAVNDVGQPAFAFIDVIVFYGPVLRLANSVVHVVVGDKAVVTCQVHANPPVDHMTWLHNGSAVNMTRDRQVEAKVARRAVREASSGLVWDEWSLVISPFSPHHLGTYGCVAINSRSTAESTTVVSACPYDLQVTSSPVSPSGSEYLLEWTVVPLSSFVQFDIIVTDASGVTVLETSVRTVQREGGEVMMEQLLIQRLTINVTHKVRLRASNDYCAIDLPTSFDFRTVDYLHKEEHVNRAPLEGNRPLPVIQQHSTRSSSDRRECSVLLFVTTLMLAIAA